MWRRGFLEAGVLTVPQGFCKCQDSEKPPGAEGAFLVLSISAGSHLYKKEDNLMLTNHSELVKSILEKNPNWQPTFEGLVKEAVPVVLLSVLCPSCDHAHIACLADDERDAFLYADGNEFVRSCARCGASLTFSTGVVLYKK